MKVIPIATLALAAGVLGGYGLELAHGGTSACYAHGFIAARPSFETALSSLFLHDPSALLHLGGNLAFLVVFGVLVELELGSLLLVALFAAAGLGGAAAHYLADPSAATPLVGCSGAICGLLALAGVIRPRLLGFVAALIGLNVWNALASQGGTVSFGAHIGGFVVGAGVAVLLRVMNNEALEVA